MAAEPKSTKPAATKPNTERKKTLTPRVIASMMIAKALNESRNTTLDAVAASYGPRINEAKFAAITAQYDKLAGKLTKSVTSYIDRFENPPPRKTKAPSANAVAVRPEAGDPAPGA